MTAIRADVVVFADIGTAYTTKTMYEIGMGGSEFQVILLANELNKKGKKVVCINPCNKAELQDGVLYLPVKEYKNYDIKCNNLIIHRLSSIPKIPHKKAFMWATDLNGPHNLHFYNYFEENKIEIITLSNFQNNLFSKEWSKHVIPFIIPDEVYNYPIPEKSGYVYASSILKGYRATSQSWVYLKTQNCLKDKQLNVCLPGYDNPEKSLSDSNFKINYLGTLPFKQVLDVIAKSEGMFYVNLHQETFGISIVLAEILKCVPYVYGINGLGSLTDVLNTKETLTTDMREFVGYFKSGKQYKCQEPNNYRANVVIEKWLNILV